MGHTLVLIHTKLSRKYPYSVRKKIHILWGGKSAFYPGKSAFYRRKSAFCRKNPYFLGKKSVFSWEKIRVLSNNPEYSHCNDYSHYIRRSKSFTTSTASAGRERGIQGGKRRACQHHSPIGEPLSLALENVAILWWAFPPEN